MLTKHCQNPFGNKANYTIEWNDNGKQLRFLQDVKLLAFKILQISNPGNDLSLLISQLYIKYKKLTQYRCGIGHFLVSVYSEMPLKIKVLRMSSFTKVKFVSANSGSAKRRCQRNICKNWINSSNEAVVHFFLQWTKNVESWMQVHPVGLCDYTALTDSIYSQFPFAPGEWASGLWTRPPSLLS